MVGANGSGKSSLLELLAGRLPPQSGRVERGPTVVVGYYAQHGPDLDPTARVRDLVAGPTRKPGDPADHRLMERFWFTGELVWATVGTLSGGERRRLQLLMVLAERPNVLLLDEPTNDLDLDTLRALEDFLEDWPGALVTVSHDRTFLDRVAEGVLACRDGGVVPVAGGLAAWIAQMEDGAALGSVQSGRHRGTARGDRPGRDETVRSAGRSSTTLGFELRRLDKEVARLTRDKDRLVEAMAATSQHQELARIGAELAEVQMKVDEAEEQWLAVAAEAETIR
ncbi:MAG: ATP-binding cassette domain-containing protein [Acidimicrobiales bacterium]